MGKRYAMIRNHDKVLFNWRMYAIAMIQFLIFHSYTTVLGQSCDFNTDMQCNCSDIDLLNDEIVNGGMDLAFDMNGDNAIDFDDKLFWLAEISTALADVNLDGEISPLDLLIIVNNFDLSSTSHCAGDVNADGIINGADAIIVLDVLNGGLLTWVGTSGNNWHTASNWDAGFVPTEGASVRILNSSNNPVVIQANNSGQATSLSIDDSASLTVQNGGTLMVEGDLDPLSVVGEILVELGGIIEISINTD